MIAYIVGTCAKGDSVAPNRLACKELRGSVLLQEAACPLDLLAAERAQEVGHEPIHQLEIGRERRRVLLRVVQDFFAVAFRIHCRAGASVDENELRPQDETL